MIRLYNRFLLAHEGLIALAIGALAAFFCYTHGAFDISGKSDNISACSALASLFGTLLGFAIATITFLFSTTGQKELIPLRASKSYEVHWQIFGGLLTSTLTATLLSVVGLWLSLAGRLTQLHTSLLVGASIWVAFRVCRVVWVMLKLIAAEVAAGNRTRQLHLSPRDHTRD